jgi:Hsp70 protein
MSPRSTCGHRGLRAGASHRAVLGRSRGVRRYGVRMDRDAFALGVDFGTSNTVAVLRGPDGRTRTLLFDGSPALASGVFAMPSGELLSGRDAAHAARSRPECYEPHPKRFIDDGQLFLGVAEVPVAAVFAAVLRRVADEASRAASGRIAEVTITHPASWGSHRRAVLLSGAAQAGLGEPRLVAEPVAAASYFVDVLGASLPVGSCVLVYDFGAGTFDASVVRRTADGFAVLASEGLPDAGGLDIDAAVVAHLGAVYSARDPAMWRRLQQPDAVVARRASRLLWEDVRTAKEMLSRTSATVIPIPLLDEDAPLGREQFELLARPILDRTVAATRGTLRSAGLTDAEVRGVFLVGGSSRIPLVATLLHRALRIAPTVIEQPELVVAEGSLHAAPVRMARPTVGWAPGPAARTVLQAAEPDNAPVPPVGASFVPSGTVPAPDTPEDTRPDAPPASLADPPPDPAAEIPPMDRAGSATMTGSSSPVEAHPAQDTGSTHGLRRYYRPLVGAMVLGLAVLLAWRLAPEALLVGVNVALSPVTTPLLLVAVLLAVAGVGVPGLGTGGSPVRWALTHAGWAAAALAVVVLLVTTWLGPIAFWDDYVPWYVSRSWLASGAAVLLATAGAVLLGIRVRRLSQTQAAGGRRRIAGYIVAALVGVVCGLWWFAGSTMIGDRPSFTACDWSNSIVGPCEVGVRVYAVKLPVKLLFALSAGVGAFLVLGTVGLLAVALRMRVADPRATATQVPVRVAALVLLLCAGAAADMVRYAHAVADSARPVNDPVATIVKLIETPSRTHMVLLAAVAALLFSGAAWLALSAQSIRRRELRRQELRRGELSRVAV